MLNETERRVLELLLQRPHSPTEVAERLDVTVQTASRNLTALEDAGYAERTTANGWRGYKRYQACEFAHVFAGFGGKLFEQTFPLTTDKRAVFGIWQVPQAEFHPTLLTLLFTPDIDRAALGIVAILVFGSVARGNAEPDSDIDVLFVYEPDRATRAGVQEVDITELLDTAYSAGGGLVQPERRHVVSETWYTVSELENAIAAGSRFLRTVLGEGIVLFDAEGVIRRAREGRAGERVSP